MQRISSCTVSACFAYGGLQKTFITRLSSTPVCFTPASHRITSVKPFNMNLWWQRCSVSTPNKADYLDVVNVSDSSRAWYEFPSINKNHLCAPADQHRSLHPTKNNGLLCGKKSGKWNSMFCLFPSKLLSLALIQNIIIVRTKLQSHPVITVWIIVYWNGSLHVSFMIAAWCLGSLIVGLCQWLLNIAYSRADLKVARLDYNCNWNIITRPAQYLCLWHNSTGGLEKTVRLSELTTWTTIKNLKWQFLSVFKTYS